MRSNAASGVSIVATSLSFRQILLVRAARVREARIRAVRVRPARARATRAGTRRERQILVALDPLRPDRRQALSPFVPPPGARLLRVPRGVDRAGLEHGAELVGRPGPIRPVDRKAPRDRLLKARRHRVESG